jgi:hypothetical protein
LDISLCHQDKIPHAKIRHGHATPGVLSLPCLRAATSGNLITTLMNFIEQAAELGYIQRLVCLYQRQ